jgi:hypothetical protein
MLWHPAMIIKIIIVFYPSPHLSPEVHSWSFIFLLNVYIRIGDIACTKQMPHFRSIQVVYINIECWIILCDSVIRAIFVYLATTLI